MPKRKSKDIPVNALNQHPKDISQDISKSFLKTLRNTCPKDVSTDMFNPLRLPIPFRKVEFTGKATSNQANNQDILEVSLFENQPIPPGFSRHVHGVASTLVDLLPDSVLVHHGDGRQDGGLEGRNAKGTHDLLDLLPLRDRNCEFQRAKKTNGGEK